MSNNLEQLRKNLADLNNREEELSDVYKRKCAVKREIAMFTAVAFVAVDSGRVNEVYGVSPEVEVSSKCGLSFEVVELNFGVVEDGTRMGIEICRGIANGWIKLYLGMDGDHLSFVAHDNEEGIRPTLYTVRSFAKKDDAEAWLRKRRLEDVSR